VGKLGYYVYKQETQLSQWDMLASAILVLKFFLVFSFISFFLNHFYFVFFSAPIVLVFYFVFM